MDSPITRLARVNKMTFASLYANIDYYFNGNDLFGDYDRLHTYLELLTTDQQLIKQVIDEFLEIKRDQLD